MVLLMRYGHDITTRPWQHSIPLRARNIAEYATVETLVGRWNMLVVMRQTIASNY